MILLDLRFNMEKTGAFILISMKDFESEKVKIWKSAITELWKELWYIWLFCRPHCKRSLPLPSGNLSSGAAARRWNCFHDSNHKDNDNNDLLDQKNINLENIYQIFFHHITQICEKKILRCCWQKVKVFLLCSHPFCSIFNKGQVMMMMTEWWNIPFCQIHLKVKSREGHQIKLVERPRRLIKSRGSSKI